MLPACESSVSGHIQLSLGFFASPCNGRLDGVNEQDFFHECSDPNRMWHTFLVFTSASVAGSDETATGVAQWRRRCSYGLWQQSHFAVLIITSRPLALTFLPCLQSFTVRGAA